MEDMCHSGESFEVSKAHTSPSLFVSLSLSVCVSLCLSVSLSVSLFLSVSVFLSLSLCLSVSVSLPGLCRSECKALSYFSSTLENRVRKPCSAQENMVS